MLRRAAVVGATAAILLAGAVPAASAPAKTVQPPKAWVYTYADAVSLAPASFCLTGSEANPPYVRGVCVDGGPALPLPVIRARCRERVAFDLFFQRPLTALTLRIGGRAFALRTKARHVYSAEQGETIVQAASWRARARGGVAQLDAQGEQGHVTYFGRFRVAPRRCR